jgi:hypothetical protein
MLKSAIHRMADEEKPYTTDTLNPFTSRNQTPLGHLLVAPGLNFEVFLIESLWVRLFLTINPASIHQHICLIPVPTMTTKEPLFSVMIAYAICQSVDIRHAH